MKMIKFLFVLIAVPCISLAGQSLPQVPPDDTAYNASSWDGNFDAATKNALRDKLETVTGGDLVSTNNLSDVSNAATSFGNIKQAATSSATGVVELSTDAEAVTGSDTGRAVTPANLVAKMAAPGAIGGTTPAAATFTSVGVVASASPGYTYKDSDNPGTDKEIASTSANYIDGADGSENGSVNLKMMDGGTEAAIIQGNASTGVVTIGGASWDTVTFEDTVTDADGFTMTAIQGHGHTIYATGAGTIVMPPVTQKMQFAVECHAAAAVVLNPDASGTEDTIRLDGVALSQGDSITSTSTAGDVAVCTYYAADTWSCITNSWTDTN